MVQTCVAYNCGYRFKKGDGVRMHKFPADTVRKKRWLTACKLANFEPGKDDRLCSEHFQPTDYASNSSLLNGDAVPSIFAFPKHLCSTPRKRPAPTDRSSSGDSSADSSASSVGDTFGDLSAIAPAVKRRKVTI